MLSRGCLVEENSLVAHFGSAGVVRLLYEYKVGYWYRYVQY